MARLFLTRFGSVNPEVTDPIKLVGGPIIVVEGPPS